VQGLRVPPGVHQVPGSTPASRGALVNGYPSCPARLRRRFPGLTLVLGLGLRRDQSVVFGDEAFEVLCDVSARRGYAQV